jgi:hypothetical protein
MSPQKLAQFLLPKADINKKVDTFKAQKNLKIDTCKTAA